MEKEEFLATMRGKVSAMATKMYEDNLKEVKVDFQMTEKKHIRRLTLRDRFDSSLRLAKLGFFRAIYLAATTDMPKQYLQRMRERLRRKQEGVE
mmetsp:Transcript_11883/g.20103  ORF Transcript_11883/g.20103 Transcript_11883/m.20103 type:complete len:94 (-) Transcript_11883:337-618(-)|eukprot:CAMPEP_0168624866 /NCGR_PEP_ID=MMETSP0449_2-20121227/9669_1 /TAXON_ID=1082188 /ORGANISM="Strombidium rassoulzadegani, Strain ras09" /LENGTH=93 /DNA_ID=CAMNT_0008666507 /DNA_START=437 /DNA_END=718 /DNA_ORIENTATION=-